MQILQFSINAVDVWKWIYLKKAQSICLMNKNATAYTIHQSWHLQGFVSVPVVNKIILVVKKTV